jgi:hypothetical protein
LKSIALVARLGHTSRVGVRAIYKKCVIPPNAVKNKGNQGETALVKEIAPYVEKTLLLTNINKAD